VAGTAAVGRAIVAAAIAKIVGILRSSEDGRGERERDLTISFARTMKFQVS
jgi:hypothetical protein